MLYSGGHYSDNDELNLESIRLASLPASKIKLTYVPSCSMDGLSDYRDFVRCFKKMGVKKMAYLPLDKKKFEGHSFLESSNIIFFSGGNTYYFLKHLRQAKVKKSLDTFLENGGVLMGLSAGAILLTPSIVTAGFPSFDCDENEDNIKNLTSLGLTNFYFFPHFKNSQRYRDELVSQSKRLDLPLVACPDESGVVIENNKKLFINRYWIYLNGKSIVF